MKKILSYLAIFAVLFVGLGSVAYSYMGQGYGNYNNQFRGGFGYEQNLEIQNQMQEIMINGNYDDLVKLREENNLPMARWVDSEEDFNLMKENYLAKEKYFEENGNKFQNGFNSGCPGFSRGGYGMRGSFYN